MTTFYRRMKVTDDNSPSARWGHSMVAVNSYIYLIGGYYNASYLNDLWIFDLNNNQFQKHVANGDIPPPCSSFSLNYYSPRNSLILFAGGTHNKGRLSGMYELDLQNFKWTQIKWAGDVIAPSPRSYHSAEIIEDYLVIFGGEFTQQLGDTWIFNFKTNTWLEIKSTLGTLKPKPSKFHSSFVYKSKFYVLGGCKASCENLDQVIYLDFTKFLISNKEQDLVWSEAEFKGQNLLKRWGAVSLVFGDYAYVYGGRITVDLQNFVEIDLKQGICRQLRILNQIPVGRRKPSACIHNHNLFVFNGYNGQYKTNYGYFQLPFHLQSLEQNQKMKQNPETSQNTKNNSYIVNLQQNLSIQRIILDLKSSKDSKYFKILQSGSYRREDFTLYPLRYFDEQRKLKLMNIFAIFLKFNKLVFPSNQKEIIFAYTIDLIMLSEYYCIDSLVIACKKQLIQLFNSQTKQKNELGRYFFSLIELMASIDNQHKEYVGFFTVKRLLLQNRREVCNFKDFENLCKILFVSYEMKWIHQMIQKYRFQLIEIINGNDPFMTEMQNRIEFLKTDSKTS